MEITILGCGSSHGVPSVNCHCFVCTSDNPRNKRTRASIFIKTKKTQILIDTSPDLRQQCLNNNIESVNAIIFTHEHSDHVAGIDDIRRLCKYGQPIVSYMDDATFAALKIRYHYIFSSENLMYPPLIKRKELKKQQKIGDVNVISFNQIHGLIMSQGIRINNVVYSTDLNKMPESSLTALQNLDIWILDCLRYSYTPTHLYLEKSLLLIERIKPKLAVLTHMGHDIEYEEISKMLPKNVIAAYDNLKLSVD